MFLISITNKPNNGEDDDNCRQWWYVGSVLNDSGCDDQLMLSSSLRMEAPKITAISTWGVLV
jgi:malate synthase